LTGVLPEAHPRNDYPPNALTMLTMAGPITTMSVAGRMHRMTSRRKQLLN